MEDKEPRDLLMIRVGKESEPVEDRVYQTALGSPVATIEKLLRVYKGKFDLVLLHDTIDDCMILNIDNGEFGVLPCRIHHRPEEKI